MGADPKLKKVAPVVYLINVFVAYTIKRLGITPFMIHLIYCVMFYTKINYVFAIHKPEKLNLTDSERQWLKHGVIQSLPPEIGCKSYILYYKNWRMEVRRKVTVGYNFIIK
ncbi:MAG: hypothetical protein J6W16_06700 [Methanobrevibacter sp.]|nr:hypothetical protein [Methanobrevibacter sp.]